MINFSMPMPYSEDRIKEINEINKKITKSKITSFFFCLPINSPERTCFEQSRSILPNLSSFNDWKPLIKSSQDIGMDLIYLINSPRPLLFEFNIFNKFIDNLNRLIEKLLSSNINKLRITHPHLISYISEKYPEIDILASTSMEYAQLGQYRNLLKLFPNIKQIVPSHDVSKNFKLLKNLKASYPNVDIELLTNEACKKSCPLRLFHSSAISYKIITKKNPIPSFCYPLRCIDIYPDDIITALFLSNFIMPWEIEEYSKIGINNFKFVGREAEYFIKSDSFDYILKYLKGIEDIKFIENHKFVNFLHYFKIADLDITIKQIKPYLPKIEHFKKFGHLCSSVCGTECTYCFDCAEKFKKDYKNVL